MKIIILRKKSIFLFMTVFFLIVGAIAYLRAAVISGEESARQTTKTAGIVRADDMEETGGTGN
jgi:CHASE3 domain sensor protein